MAQPHEINSGFPVSNRRSENEPPAVLRLAGMSLLHRLVKDWQTEFEPRHYPDWQPRQSDRQQLRPSGQGTREAG